jgi:hypothetical protein
MAFRRTTSFKTSGPVDQPTLDALRSRLQLSRMGRLTDDWDQIFGRRQLHVDNGRVNITLLRDDVRAGWDIDIDRDGHPAQSTIDSIEAEITNAAAMCGLTVESVLRIPDQSDP